MIRPLKYVTLMLLDSQDKMREDYLHIFTPDNSTEKFWYSLCHEAVDDLNSHDSFFHCDLESDIKEFLQEYQLTELPPLCSKCRDVQTMLELAE